MEWLERIPGPEFLMGYILFSLVSIVTVGFLTRDKQEKMPLLDKNQLDPIFFAVLRGDWRAAVDVAVVELMESKVIGVIVENSRKMLVVQNKTDELTPLQKVVCDFLATPKTTAEFSGSSLKEAAQRVLYPVYRELEKCGFRKSDQTYGRNQLICFSLLILLDGLAIVRIMLGLAHNKPVFFLVLLLPIISVAVFLVLRPMRRITALGRRYIQDVTNHYSWLQNDSSHGATAMKMALGTAVFGIGFLAVSDFFEDYRAFAQSGRGGSSGGCGGDSGGGCGGSSDGGSGCGGGGCGGCGGGGD